MSYILAASFCTEKKNKFSIYCMASKGEYDSDRSSVNVQLTKT